MKIEITDDSGYRHIHAIFKHISDKDMIHLGRTVSLPVIHAAVIHNIKRGGRRSKFAAWNPRYAIARQKMNLHSHNTNKQPISLGRQELQANNTKLILTNRLFHHLGTIHQSTEKGVVYGVNPDSILNTYLNDVIYGTSGGKRKRVLMHEHTRTSKYGKVYVVPERYQTITVGRIPARNPFYLMPSDSTIITKAYVEYLVSDHKTREIKIKTRGLPFTARREVRVLPVTGYPKSR